MTKVTEANLAELKDLIISSEKKIEQSIQALDKKIDDTKINLGQKIDVLQKDITDLKIGQARMDTEIKSIKDEVKELKTTQKAQIWALITLAFTAVITLSAAISKFIFFPDNP
jgi:peptidoglycan hydrolase CwlO-like protein